MDTAPHDALIAYATAVAFGITIARSPEARAQAAACAATAAEAIRRYDRLRYAVAPGRAASYVEDTWDGRRPVDQHTTECGADEIAARMNARNVEDGQAELARHIADQTDRLATVPAPVNGADIVEWSA